MLSSNLVSRETGSLGLGASFQNKATSLRKAFIPQCQDLAELLCISEMGADSGPKLCFIYELVCACGVLEGVLAAEECPVDISGVAGSKELVGSVGCSTADIASLP